MTTMEKIRLILDDVMEGNIVVLEKGLTPDEQSRLIEVTMLEITPDGFSGIEMETYSAKDTGSSGGGLFGRLLGKKGGRDTHDSDRSCQPDENNKEGQRPHKRLGIIKVNKNGT